MTRSEIGLLVRELKSIFDVVRLVDVSMTEQYAVGPEGELTREPYACYAVWDRERRCENCVSAKALARKCRMTKFEFIHDEIYFVVSKYAEVEGVPYVLEMVAKVNDQTLFGAYGRNQFIETINAYNAKLYLDQLTGAYNRQYFNEQLSGLPKVNALAMVDVDDFKRVNDRFGHTVGDLVLQEVVAAARSALGARGAVVRFGGDEFVLAFQGVSGETLAAVLEDLRRRAAELRLPGLPELRVTLSIGAVYLARGGAAAYLDTADRALYRAKAEKNRVRIACVSESD